MTRFRPKSILPVMALIGVAGAFLAFAEPANAAKKTCLQKYNDCNRRCAGAAGPGESWLPCINRTCNRQHDNCMAGK
jgi:hypothetical protein